LIRGNANPPEKAISNPGKPSYTPTIMERIFRLFALICLMGLPLCCEAQFWNDFDVPPHSYVGGGRKLQDPVTLFLEKLERGEVTVTEANGLPLVKRLLAEFDVPESSQVLVFTKTSLQKETPGSVPGYEHLAEEEKRNLLEILIDTRESLPSFSDPS